MRRSAEVGTLDETTAEIITRSLEFPARTAADVMTPRVRTQVVRVRESAADVVALARRTGYSRFPVVDEGLDDVVGVVHLKTAIAVPRERREAVPVAALMADAVRVPETVRLDPLLDALRAQGLQMAVVVDEYGGTAGVVTLEDVVEELVGEVSDEHDRSRTGIVRLRDGSYVVPGLLRPDEVRARADLAVPDGTAFETVGGFVMAALGRVPAGRGPGRGPRRGAPGRPDGRPPRRPAPRCAAAAGGAAVSGGSALLLAFGLLLLNAFFVGAEFAVISARRSQIEPLADAGSRRGPHDRCGRWSTSR